MNKYIDVESIDVPELEIFRMDETQLKRYYEPKLGYFLVESAKVVSRALASGYEVEVTLAERSLLNNYENKAVLESLKDGSVVYVATRDQMKELTGFNLTRGLVCVMKRRPLPELTDVVKGTRRIAILEDVENPTNVGAIMRSAAALGMEAVLLTKGSCDPLYRRASRVSMGTVFQVPWTFIESVDEIRKFGYKTAAMSLRDDSVDIDDASLKDIDKLAIILGTEGDGLKPETIAGSDISVKIPMYNGVDSLNVSAAAAVAFFSIR